jgi:hypothetical protein
MYTSENIGIIVNINLGHVGFWQILNSHQTGMKQLRISKLPPCPDQIFQDDVG